VLAYTLTQWQHAARESGYGNLPQEIFPLILGLRQACDQKIEPTHQHTQRTKGQPEHDEQHNDWFQSHLNAVFTKRAA
jgi:hypothetical protein